MKRAATLLLILAAGACSRTPAPQAGELRVIPLGGDVRILQDGESSILEEATTVDSGVGLVTGVDGRAQVELPGGSTVELAPQAKLEVNGDEPHIAKGSALVHADSAITVNAGLDAEISASDSIFRIDSDVSIELAVYRGAATVLGSGVPAIEDLEQVVIVQGGGISRSPVPLRVRPNHPWDARILGDAIDLGLRLLGLERGLTRQLPTGQEVQAISQTLEPDFSPSEIKSAIADLGDAARVVVAAVLAGEVERLDGRPRDRILSEVVNLRTLGASWIVVVGKLGLSSAATQVLASLGDVAGTIAKFFLPAPGPTSPATSTDTGSGEGGPADDPDGDDGGSVDPPPEGNDNNRGGNDGENGPPAPPPDEPDDNPPAQECGNEVECAVDDIFNDTPRAPDGI